jgi:hypothetical protein
LKKLVLKKFVLKKFVLKISVKDIFPATRAD